MDRLHKFGVERWRHFYHSLRLHDFFCGGCAIFFTNRLHDFFLQRLRDCFVEKLHDFLWRGYMICFVERLCDFYVKRLRDFFLVDRLNVFSILPSTVTTIGR